MSIRLPDFERLTERTGDVWSTAFRALEDRRLLKSLSAVSQATPAISELSGLIGRHTLGSESVEWKSVPFTDAQVRIRTGESSYAPVTDPSTFSGMGQMLHFQPLWRLQLEAPLEPSVLLASTHVLIAGIDFWLGEGGLVFTQDPRMLWADRRLLVLAGWTRGAHGMAYAAQSPETVEGRMSEVTSYKRSFPSVDKLLRATAAACGLPWVETTTTIREVRDMGSHTTYWTDHGPYRLSFPHTPFAVDTVLHGGMVFGGLLQMLGAPSGSTDWASSIELGQGLHIGGLTPYALLLPDKPMPAEIVDNSGNLELTIDLGSGNVSLENVFWDWVRGRELIIPRVLARTAGFVGAGEASANPARIFFAHHLASRAILVHLSSKLENTQTEVWIRRMLLEDAPVSSILLRTPCRVQGEQMGLPRSQSWLDLSCAIQYTRRLT